MVCYDYEKDLMGILRDDGLVRVFLHDGTNTFIPYTFRWVMLGRL